MVPVRLADPNRPKWTSSGQNGRTLTILVEFAFSGKKKEPKPKLVGPDIFGWGGGLPREGVGAKKLGMSLEAQQTKLFGGISRDFWLLEKLRREHLCSILVPYLRQCSIMLETKRF